MTKLVLDTTTSGINIAKINENFQKISDEFQDKVLYRTNPVGEPNSFSSDVDMNGKKVFNASDIRTDELTLDGVAVGASIAQTLADATAQQVIATTKANEAAASATAAQTSGSAIALAAALAASSGAGLVGDIAGGAGSVVTTVHAKLQETYSIKSAGAIGNGSAELTKIQTAFTDAITLGLDVYIPNGIFDGGGGTLVLSSPVGFYGPGTLRNIIIQVGVSGAQVNWYRKFSTVLTGASSKIYLLGARHLDISVVFEGCSKAIHGFATSASAFHSISVVDISNSRFIACGRDVSLERDAGVTELVFSDWKDGSSKSSFPTEYHFYADQIDGIEIYAPLVIFQRGAVTKNAYRLKNSEWVSISGPGNLFECGEEAILLEEAGSVSIRGGLNIAFCGQQAIRSGIKIVNTAKFLTANIGGIIVEKPTSHLVEITSPTGWAGRISGVTGTVDERVGSGGSQTYFGATALNTVPHYMVSTPTTSTRSSVSGNQGTYTNISGTSAQLPDNVLGSFTFDSHPVRYTGDGAEYRSVAVGGPSVSILRVESIFGTQNSIDGMLLVTAKNADSDAAGTKSASYILHAHCGADGNSITLISALGDTAGPAVDSPSFTWSISVTKVLQASAVGITDSTFHFFVTYLGNIQLRF